MADGIISKIQLPDNTIYDVVDNTSGYMTGMTILSYGSSTWQNFIDAYSSNKVVYCRASSNANPATGSQTRLAFMAYVNNATTPTEVEFQYYRSVSSHTASQQGDQVFVYKLNKTNGWSVTVREASVKVVAGTGLGGTYSKGTMTLTGPTKVSDLTNDSGFITSYTETDPIFSASAAAGITSTNISSWNNKVENFSSGNITSSINPYVDEGFGYIRYRDQRFNEDHTASIDYGVQRESNVSYSQVSLGADKIDFSGRTSFYNGNNSNYPIYLDVPTNLTNAVAITLPSNNGTLALTSDLPDVSGKIDTAGTGLSKSGTTLNHSNSITAQTTSGIYPIKIDAQGHITEYGNAVTIPTITLNGSSITSPSFYAPTSAGTSGYVLTSSGSGAPSWTSAVLTDEKVKTSTTVIANYDYGVVFGSCSNTTETKVVSSAFQYLENGTNESYLRIGSTSKKGYISLIGASNYKAHITPTTLTSTRTFTLPDASGTIALTSDIPANEIFIAEYNSTSFNAICNAYMSGQTIICHYDIDGLSGYVPLIDALPSLDPTAFVFTGFSNAALDGVPCQYLYIGRFNGWDASLGELALYNHIHGNITNTGDITTTTTIANGDRLVINDESASKVTNSSITFGSSTSQYLANNGTWQSVPSVAAQIIRWTEST